MKIALCLWGLCRSTKYTYESFEKMIIQPLKASGINYDIYLHNFTLHRPYSNYRSDETACDLDNESWKMYNPTKWIVEDQDEVDMSLNLRSYRSQGDPWNTSFVPFQTLDNHIRSLYSLSQVTTLWLPHADEYQKVVFLRPDVAYQVPLQIEWLRSEQSNFIFMPSFHVHPSGTNDRFAIGPPWAMAKYGLRYHQALRYSYDHQLHSETFLAHTLKLAQIHPVLIDFPFVRVRADGNVSQSDLELVVTHETSAKGTQQGPPPPRATLKF